MAEQRSSEGAPVMAKSPGKAISVLEEFRHDLETRMATKLVLTQLQRVGLLDRDGSRRIMALPDHRRNEEILGEVQRRGPDAPLKFLHALWPVHSTLSEKIASKIWPYRTQVLWFVENPSHAAIVVDLLRESRELGLKADFTFGGVLHTNCFFQRGLLCHEDGVRLDNDEMEGLEVVVVFPATAVESSDALISAFSDVKADVAVMSGVCKGERWREEGREGGIRCGDTIVVTQAFDGQQETRHGNSIGPQAEVVQGLQGKLQEVFGAQDQPKWMDQVKTEKQEEESLRSQTLWLTRLFLELTKLSRAEGGQKRSREEGGGGDERKREGEGEETERVGGERRESGVSQEGRREREREGAEVREPLWLARPEIGWDMNEPSLLNKHNQFVLTQLLPDWENGRLVSTLLHHRQLWTVDPASPLGMAPSQKLVTMVEQAIKANPHFPCRPTSTPAATPSFPLPVFGAVATTHRTDNGRATGLPSSALATDFFSHQFYQICSDRQRLGPDRPCLVCKAVSYEMGGGERACVMASSCVVLEALRQLAKEIGARKEEASPD